MKKLILIPGFVLLFIFVSIYVFIPATITIVRVVPVKCTASAAFAYFSSEHKWADWWPGQNGAGRSMPYTYKGYRYQLARLSYYNADVLITGRETNLTGRISIFPGGTLDSTLLQWVSSLPTGKWPFERIRQYQRAKEIGRNMEDILRGAGTFLGEKENVYGVAIRETTTTDSFLVATKARFSSHPSTKDIYKLIYKVQEYMMKAGARQTGYPMMNVTSVDSSSDWKVTIAVPADRELEKDGGFYYMRLIPGKYLTAYVRGGEAAVNKAMGGVTNYIRDYQRTVMAIPFQSLITDRMAETDTARWETRLYYPVF